MKIVFRITYFLSFIFFISGCVRFPIEHNPHPLSHNNLSKLNGNYKIEAQINDNTTNAFWKHLNVFQELDRKFISNRFFFLDSLKSYFLQIEILNNKMIRVSYFENNHNIKDLNLKYNLKPDGYVYLKNKNTKIWLVPYLFGALDIKKIRMTINPENNLVFDVVNHRSGALLFICFLDFKTWKYNKVYERILK